MRTVRKCCSFAACAAALAAVALFTASSDAADWTRFRGPGGSGISPDSTPTPITWSEDENLKWSVKLPGPGHSCPIVHGDRVFVTCWTGYAAGEGSSDDQEDLKRALVCLDRQTGETRWMKTVDAVLPEDEYGGMFAQHGYATHTPVTDGERVYVFFGKSGVVAFDMQGEQLWRTRVGDGLDPRRWGSSSSPVLYEDLVIVTASAESQAMYGLDKETGEVVWRQAASKLGGTWSTPVLVPVDEDRTDLVAHVPGEIWGMNPNTGELRWFAQQGDGDTACPSVVAADGVVYLLGNRDSGSIAVRVGGRGDVTDTHVVWRGNDRGRIGTPLVHDGYLYWINGAVARCVSAEDGQTVAYEERLEGASGGRDFRSGDYSSPVAADGKLYFVSRGGAMFVLALGPEFEQLATNRFESETGEFSATPAVSDGEIFIRSTNKLYCVAAE